jgi:hypothetical protein
MSFNKCAERVDTDKLKIVSDKENQSLLLCLITCLLFDFESSFIDLRYEISLVKLMKTSNSIFNQVDWSIVVLSIIDRERSIVYRDIFN